MDRDASPDFATHFAARLRAAHTELTARWLERIVDRVALDPLRVFPMDDLLDHMPLLVDGISYFVEDPARAVATQSDVVSKAQELGALRFGQGFSEHELQKEYEILGGVLFAFLSRVVSEMEQPPSPDDSLICAQRLFQAIAIIQQVTTTQFLRHVTQRLSEREDRLQAFHRALTHELRNRLGATLGAGRLLALPDLPEEHRAELIGVVVRNADGMRIMLDNLLELSRVRGESRQQRHVRLPDAAAEAARQLRDTMRRAGCTVRIAPDLPNVEVNAAVVELCLTNLLSNAAKYTDPTKSECWVEVRGWVHTDSDGTPRDVVVQVVDNGRGVPAERRDRLFERFYRAHENDAPGIEGTGLGLSIVRDSVEALGGRAWAEFPETGSAFAFSLPCRRVADSATLRQPRAPEAVSE
jgi:signal transduction histidine kinase